MRDKKIISILCAALIALTAASGELPRLMSGSAFISAEEGAVIGESGEDFDLLSDTDEEQAEEELEVVAYSMEDTYTSGDYEYTVADGKATITKYNGSAEILEIPGVIDGYPVTAIGYSAFSYCKNLTNITIPNSVTKIGSSAFMYCTNLTSIALLDSVTSIEREAFYGCDSLVSITIPNSVTSIGILAFSCCTSLANVTLSDSMTSISHRAFELCTELTSIVIPDGVTSIGICVFASCSKLTSIVIPKSVTSIDEWAFMGCSSLYIYGYTGSYAETYANEYNAPFIAIDAPSAPTFTPDGGTFTEAQAVTIECTTTGAEIYYTLDGSVPTASSTKYTAPVSVTESATLKAVAIKDGLSSAVTSADFTINLSETESSGFYSDEDGKTLSEAALYETITQVTAVKNGKHDVRFIKKVNADDLSGKSKATFTLTSSEEGKTPRTVSTRKYYTGLTYDDGTRETAAGGQVFLCYTVKDVPAGVTVEATAIDLE